MTELDIGNIWREVGEEPLNSKDFISATRTYTLWPEIDKGKPLNEVNLKDFKKFQENMRAFGANET
jgi:hypothetical protein